MRILIDECLPKKLKHEFTDHEASTVVEMGWSGKKNGELLKLMSAEFGVFVTVDQNLQYQHHRETLSIAIIVLVAVNNKLESLKPLIPAALEQLKVIQPGEIIEIE